MVLEEMQLKDVLKLVNAFGNKNEKKNDIWQVGSAYFIRTVTMHLIGRVEVLNDHEILLKNAVWVADSGRFNNALKKGELEEVEPFEDDVILNRDCIVDATRWNHTIPDSVK